MDAPATPSERTREPQAEEAVLVDKTLVYWLCWFGAWFATRFACRMRVEGREHLPRSGGAILCSNHQSHLDILALAAANTRHVSFVARDTLANWRWLAFTMRQCGAVLVQRGASDRKALRAMARHLELGDLVIIFPEGTRTEDGRLREFKGGALLAARMAGVPIVPVGIRGAIDAWPRGRAFPLPRKLGLRFGAPIDSALPDAQERVVAAVQALIGDGHYDSVAPS